MITNKKYFNCINSIYSSKKINYLSKYNIFSINVNKKFTKKDIKESIFNIFNVKVKKINTLLVIKKKKNKKNKSINLIKSWKKTYIFLEKKEKDININKLNFLTKDVTYKI